MEKLLQAKRQKATLELKDRGDDVPEDIRQADARPQTEADPPATAPAAEPMADELRALIEQYELILTRNARQLVEEAGPGPEELPPAD